MEKTELRTRLSALVNETVNVEELEKFTVELESVFDENETMKTKVSSFETQFTQQDEKIKDLQKQNFNLYMSGFGKPSPTHEEAAPKEEPKATFDDVLSQLREKK